MVDRDGPSASAVIREAWGKLRCWVGSHNWTPWQLNDENTEPPKPVIRLWSCRRCGRISSV